VPAAAGVEAEAQEVATAAGMAAGMAPAMAPAMGRGTVPAMAAKAQGAAVAVVDAAMARAQ